MKFILKTLNQNLALNIQNKNQQMGVKQHGVKNQVHYYFLMFYWLAVNNDSKVVTMHHYSDNLTV